MNLLETLAANPLIHRFGYALVHFLLQGLVIAVILSAALQLLRGRSPRVRYLTAWVALLAMAVSIPITVWLVASPTPPELASIAAEPSATELPAAAAETSAGVTGPDRVDRQRNDKMAEMPLALTAVESPAVVPREARNDASTSDGSTLRVRISQSMRPALPCVVYGWLVGVFALSLWRLGGWIHVRRLCRCGTSPAPQATQQILGHLLSRLRVSHAVRLLESTLVKVPTVIGWLRPVILLPVAILAEMPSQQLEMILAHELAHIRRYDFLLNLVQTAVETLLFYHPAVWWVSRRIRIEREACCDDLAAAAAGDRLLYARALTKLEELRHEAPSAARAGLGVAADGGSLLSRIRQVLGLPGDDQEGRRPWLGGSVAVLLLIGALAGYAAIAAEAPATPAQQAPAQKKAGNHRADGAAAKQSTTGKPTEERSDPWARKVDQIMARADELGAQRNRRSGEYLGRLSDEELAKLYGRWAAQGGIAFDAALAAVRKDRQAIVDAMLKHGAGPFSEAEQAALRRQREKLAEELAALGVEAVPALLREMQGGKADRPVLAHEALVRMGHSAVEPLLKLWNDPDAPKEAVIDILAQLGDPRSKDIFLAALDDENDWIRSCACGGLLRLGPDVVGRNRLQTILIAKLEDADCLHDALRGLAEYGDKAAVGPLRVFAQHWPSRGKADLRRSAHLAIREILRRAGAPVPEAFQREFDSEPAPSAEELYAAAACGNAGIRQIALQRLTDHRGERTARFLLKRLEKEPRDDVLAEVYYSLGLSVLPPRDNEVPAASASVIQDAFNALIVAARDTRDKQKDAAISAARTVVHAASQSKTPLEGVGRFKQLIRDGLSSDRGEMMTSYYSAITAIAITAGTATTGWPAEERKQLQQELLPRLKNTLPDIRLIECLGHVGDERAVSSLMKLLEHENAMVLQFAASSLGQIGDSRAIPLLRRLADSDPARYQSGVFHVREAAARAIRAIEEKGPPEVPAAPAGEAQSKPAEGAAFGPVTERTVAYREGFPSEAVAEPRPMYLDLDTGAYAKFKVLPAGKMIREAGVDVHYEPRADGRGMRLATSNLQLQPLSDKTGWDSSPEDVWRALTVASPYSLTYPGRSTLAFKTRDGGIGILQIIGFTKDRRGIRIRYKLLQRPKAGRSATAPATQPIAAP